MKRLAVLAVLLALAAIAAELVAGGETVPAKHQEGAGASRGAACYMAPNANPTLSGTFSRVGCVRALARNIIGAGSTAGKPLEVCAGPNHDDSTKAAIAILNEELGVTVFAWKEGGIEDDNCAHSTSGTTVTSVIVTDGYYTGSGTQPEACRTSTRETPGFACIRHFSVKGSPHYAYYGRAEIRVHPNLDVVTSAETATGRTMYGSCPPSGRSVNKQTTRVRICNSTTVGNRVPGRADGTLELTRHLAHELMHVLGLRDYYCRSAPLNTNRALMDSNFNLPCRPPRMQDGNRADTTKTMLTGWDHADYEGIYSPAPATRFRIETLTTQLRFRWTAGHVHAEKGFRIERRVGTAWRAVPGATTGRDRTTVRIAKPSSAQTYRVVSLTDALPQATLLASATWPTIRYTPPRRTTTPTPTPTPRNRAPTFSPSNVSRTVAENTAAGVAIGSPVRARDGDGDTLTYTLGGSDRVAFTLDRTTGQLRTKAALDYERKSTYRVTVTVSDGQRGATATVTVRVRNVDEPGTLTLTLEDAKPTVGKWARVTLSDPDGSISGATWRWERRKGSSGSWTAIPGASRSDTYTPAARDKGYHLRATVTYADGHGTGKRAIAQTASAVVGAAPDITPAPTPTPTPAPCALPAAAARYDANGNCKIELPEVIKTIDAYLFGPDVGRPTLVDVVKVIDLYLFPEEAGSPQRADSPGATPSASRSFSATSVAPGGQVTITVQASGYGRAGGVMETLPAGWRYVSSSLPNSAVKASGSTVRFILFGKTSFTYTVTAPSTAGSYTFSGSLRNFSRTDTTVAGATAVTVK